jgi:hypothetical protein
MLVLVKKCLFVKANPGAPGYNERIAQRKHSPPAGVSLASQPSKIT